MRAVDDALELVRKFQAAHPGKRIAINSDGKTELVDATTDEINAYQQLLMRAIMLTDKKYRFVELCKYYIQGYNPRLDREIIALDCILAVPDLLLPNSESMRHLAYFFCRDMTQLLRRQEYQPQLDSKELVGWLKNWWEQHG